MLHEKVSQLERAPTGHAWDNLSIQIRIVIKRIQIHFPILIIKREKQIRKSLLITVKCKRLTGEWGGCARVKKLSFATIIKTVLGKNNQWMLNLDGNSGKEHDSSMELVSFYKVLISCKGGNSDYIVEKLDNYLVSWSTLTSLIMDR